MKLGIDAFNISSGGGLTHLKEFISAARPEEYGFTKVYLWGSAELLNKIKNKRWLVKLNEPFLNKNLFFRLYGHKFKSKSHFINKNCDIILTPGGISLSGFKPNVTMCRNMLPFEWLELFRYGLSIKAIKLILLRFLQIQSFKKADGLIFLSKYAKKIVTKFIPTKKPNFVTIPHGVNPIFFKISSKKNKSYLSSKQTIRLIYISNISPYKHHLNVVKAIHQVRKSGLSIEIDLVGKKEEGMPLLNRYLKRYDPKNEFVFIDGAVEYEHLHYRISKADIGIFASSCENLPNILLEKMASGLPIACSNMGPMPEILGNAGKYFNPLCAKDIELAIKKLISSKKLREKLGKKAKLHASLYTWGKCADNTLRFLSKTTKQI